MTSTFAYIIKIPPQSSIWEFLTFDRWPLLFEHLYCCPRVSFYKLFYFFCRKLFLRTTVFSSCDCFPGWMVISPLHMSLYKVNWMCWCSGNNYVLIEGFLVYCFLWKKKKIVWSFIHLDISCLPKNELKGLIQ